MRDALLTAQRAADDMKSSAGQQAELAVREAEAKAREIVNKAYAERSRVQRDVERLRAEEQRFRARLRSLLGSTLQTVRDHEELLVTAGDPPRR